MAARLCLYRTITNDDGQTLLEALIGPKRDQLNRCNRTTNQTTVLVLCASVLGALYCTMLLLEVDRTGGGARTVLVPRGRSPCVVPRNWVHGTLTKRAHAQAWIALHVALCLLKWRSAAAKGIKRTSTFNNLIPIIPPW